jgi:hypothetical protein
MVKKLKRVLGFVRPDKIAKLITKHKTGRLGKQGMRLHCKLVAHSLVKLLMQARGTDHGGNVADEHNLVASFNAKLVHIGCKTANFAARTQAVRLIVSCR